MKRSSGLVQFLRLFANPLVTILLLAAIVSAILGDRINASIIIAIVLLSNLLNFVQTYRSKNAVEQLRAGVAPTATALRDVEFTRFCGDPKQSGSPITCAEATGVS